MVFILAVSTLALFEVAIGVQVLTEQKAARPARRRSWRRWPPTARSPARRMPLAATILADERTISFSFARKPLSSRQAEVK